MTRLLALLILLNSSLIGGEIHLMTSDHQHVVVDMLSGEDFGDVKAIIAPTLDMVNEQLMVIYQGKVLEDHENVDSYLGEEVFIAEKASRYTSSLRSYWEPLSTAEQQNIHYILTTLAYKSLLSLPKHRPSLEAAGARIAHVHPLKFLQYAYSDEELKVCMGTIQGRSFVWKKFITDFAASFHNEVKKGNVTKAHIEHFADTISVKIELIIPHAESQDWVKFVKTLNAHVPRSANQKRYNI